MNWKFEPKTGSFTYHEYNGAYGYSVMPYRAKSTDMFSGYALYFHNGWRTEKPLGEYITRNAKLSSVFSEPSMGLLEDLVFNTVEEAQAAAEIHHAKGEESTSYENDLDDVEEPNIWHND